MIHLLSESTQPELLWDVPEQNLKVTQHYLLALQYVMWQGGDVNVLGNGYTYMY